MISKDSILIKQYKNSLKIDLDQLLISIVKKNEAEILDIHRDQLRKGQAGDGDMPEYMEGYLNFKKSLPSYFGGGKTDLYITGSFQESEYIRLSGSQWEIDSRDGKTASLLDKYGERIFELNPNSLTMVQEFVTPIFNKEVHLMLNK